MPCRDKGDGLDDESCEDVPEVKPAAERSGAARHIVIDTSSDESTK